jgi:hypothetical protein
VARATYHVPPIQVSSCMDFFGAAGARAVGVSPSGAAAAAWPSANLAIYHPFFNSWWYPIRRLFWGNGGTSGSNMDIGIYSRRGTLIISTGTTARVGTTNLQYVSVDYLLPPGGYYLGQVCSGTTGMMQSIGGTWTAAAARACGLLQEALGSTVLPNAMTPAAFTGTAVPLAGFTLDSSL